jgi:hypothetical protein
MELEKRQQLIKFISADRFARYESAAGGDALAALRLYAWNIALSSAFWGPLQVLEVALRNVVHDRLIARFGQEDWWHAPSLTLTTVHRQAITAAYARLKQERKMPTSGRVVAQLSLGFWIGLLGTGLNYEMTLWRPTLRHAFTDVKTRKDLYKDLDRLRTFRNRIAHHEPIFHRHLAADHMHIVRLIGLISPVAAEWVTENSRVEAILAGRPAPGRQLLASSF